MSSVSVILVVLFMTSCFSVPLPSSFPKCNRKQADFNDCFTNAAKVALHHLREAHPEVGLPSFHPLILPQVDIAAGTSAVHLNQKFKDIKIDKFTEFSSLNVSIGFDKPIALEVEVYYPEVNCSFEYDIDGQILVMPIRGKGPGNMTVENALIKLTLNLEENNNNHYKVINAKVIFEKIGGFHVNFENLFDGDEALNANINNAINQNWRDVFNDVKGGYEAAAVAMFQGIFEKFFAAVTVTELFGEP